MTKADRAKKYLAYFLSESHQIPIYASEDLIEETQRICNILSEIYDYRGYNSIPEVIEDYLGLDDRYAWIFEPPLE